jgi:hypothetical protein
VRRRIIRGCFSSLVRRHEDRSIFHFVLSRFAFLHSDALFYIVSLDRMYCTFSSLEQGNCLLFLLGCMRRGGGEESIVR